MPSHITEPPCYFWSRVLLSVVYSHFDIGVSFSILFVRLLLTLHKVSEPNIVVLITFSICMATLRGFAAISVLLVPQSYHPKFPVLNRSLECTMFRNQSCS